MITLSFELGTLAKGVALLLGAAVAFLLARGVLRLLRRLMFAPTLHGTGREALAARWKEIEAMAAQGGEMNLKMAVMEADKLLDHALKSMAMPGQTLGDRLKFAAYKFPKIRNVWSAHRVRNQLAHEPTFYLDPGMARNAIREFRDALRHLNVL